MKKHLIWLILPLLFACREKTPDPDQANNKHVKLTEKWRYEYPADENLYWINADLEEVLYLTVSDDRKNLHFYRFTKEGELLSKVTVENETIVNNTPSRHMPRRLNNWVQLPQRYSLREIVNVANGESISGVRPEEADTGRKFDLFLSRDNMSFYQRYLSSDKIGVYSWNLENNDHKLLDILEVNKQMLTGYQAIAEFDRFAFNNYNHDHSWIYLKSELQQHTFSYQFGLEGFQYGRLPFERWTSESAFGVRANVLDAQAKVDGDHLFVFFDDIICCFDLVQNKLLWKKQLHDVLMSEVLIHDQYLFYFVGFQIKCLNKHTGQQVWGHMYVGGPRYLALENGIIATTDMVKLIPNEILGKKTTHLQLRVAESGQLLLSWDDPFGNGIEKINDLNYGLQRALDLKDNVLYLADDKVFGAFDLKID